MESFDLLRTKLTAPRPRRDGLPRQRLVRHLAEALSCKLTLLVAPPGFGKTTAAVEWLAAPREQAVPTAWLALDEADSDPVRFWAYVAAALEGLQLGIGQDALALLRSPRLPRLESVLVPLLNALTALPGDAVLFLDDYHLIADDATHTAMAFFLDHLPPQLHVVLLTRTAPPLPLLAAWRARGDLLELTAQDLRFTPDEADAVLAGMALSPEDRARVQSGAEGWPAGLRLAALALKESVLPSAVMAGVAGGHRYLVDYLVQEVLAHQPEPVQSFLLRTAVLDRFTADLAAAVTGLADAAALLADLERKQLFLLPLGGEWYRCHTLVREALEARLAQVAPADVPQCHRRAALWLAQHNLPLDAIRHATRAADWPLAAGLMEAGADRLAAGGEYATLLGLLEALPAEVVLARPALALQQARALIMAGRPAAVPELVAAAAARPAGVEGPLLTLQAFVARGGGDLRGAAGLARQALELLPPDAHTWRSLAAISLANVYSTLGDLPEAINACARAAANGRTGADHDMAVLGLAFQGELTELLGDLHGAAACYSEAAAYARSHPQAAIPSAGWAEVGLGHIAYERNDLPAAESHLLAGIAHAERFGHVDTLMRGYGWLALVRQALGDPDGALAAIDTLDGCRHRYRLPFTDTIVEIARARLFVARGEHKRVAAWARETAARPPEEPGLERLTRLTRALVHIRLEEPRPALEALAGLPAEVLQAQVLRAAALALAGDTKSALALLAPALAVSAQQGHVRTFLEVGPVLQPLLRGAGAAPQGLIEPLSDRELEVLRFMAAGCSNLEIAERAFITVGTVKRHLHNIFGKLGADSRVRALAKARELGLVD